MSLSALLVVHGWCLEDTADWMLAGDTVGRVGSR